MPVAPPSPGQSLTVEYVVTGALDGTTLAPPIVRDASDPNATPFDPENQIYRVEVENLGIIDPDLQEGGSIGPRCIPFFWIGTDELGDLDAAIELVAELPDDTFRVQKNVSGSLAGKAGIYLDTGFMVAQGSSIRVVGFAAASPTDPIRVRVSIEIPTSCADFALGVIAEKTGSGGGGGTLCDQTPPAIMAGSSGSAGTENEGSRCDHSHPVPVDTPVAIGTTNLPGDSTALVRANHVHAHGDLPGGNLHALCSDSAAGFMSPEQCQKLDGIGEGAGPAVLSFGAETFPASARNDRWLYPWGGRDIAGVDELQMPVPHAGVIRRLYVHIQFPSSPPGTPTPITYTVYKNGAPTALAVTIDEDQANGDNLSDEVTVAAGDLLSLKVTKPTTSGTPDDIVAMMDYAAS